VSACLAWSCLVPSVAVSMRIETILGNVDFAPNEHLAERRLPPENLFPSFAPDKLACFARPELCRLVDRFSIHPPILTETFDSSIFREIPRWFENALLNQVRLNVVMHGQSLICRRNSQGKHALRMKEFL